MPAWPQAHRRARASTHGPIPRQRPRTGTRTHAMHMHTRTHPRTRAPTHTHTKKSKTTNKQSNNQSTSKQTHRDIETQRHKHKPTPARTHTPRHTAKFTCFNLGYLPRLVSTSGTTSWSKWFWQAHPPPPPAERLPKTGLFHVPKPDVKPGWSTSKPENSPHRREGKTRHGKISAEEIPPCCCKFDSEPLAPSWSLPTKTEDCSQPEVTSGGIQATMRCTVARVAHNSMDSLEFLGFVGF